MPAMYLITIFLLIGIVFCSGSQAQAQQGRSDDKSSARTADRFRARELGIHVGILPAGKWNAITDVPGVKVGHKTLWAGDSIRTGVTVVIPHDGNIYQEKVPAAIHCGNGFGKLAGFTQVKELGTLETPIALTNTLSVSACMQGLIAHTLNQPQNAGVRSVNAVVGETNDGYLNDIRGMHVKPDDTLAAIAAAGSGPVKEGTVGAGTGTSCFGYKGGIGTSSRCIPADLGGYTVGVLVQSNYGGILTVNGAPVGRELGNYSFSEYARQGSGENPSTKESIAPASQSEQDKNATTGDGSCMIVVATDAPLTVRNLERLAARATLGLAQTGSYMSNGSGDYVITFSTGYRIPNHDKVLDPPVETVANHAMNPLFLAVVEATEEALYNSMFKATTVTGKDNHTRQAIPLDRVKDICKRYNVLDLDQRLSKVSNEH